MRKQFRSGASQQETKELADQGLDSNSIPVARPCRSRLGLLTIVALAIQMTASVLGQDVSLHEDLILNPSPHRIGINIGSQDFYSGELLKNLVCNLNCGFEPVLTQEIWQVASGSTTSFSTSAVWDPAPANYWVGANVEVVQSDGRETGCKAKVTAQTQSVSGKRSPEFSFAPACAAPLHDGDLVILSRTLIPTPEQWWESSGGGIWGEVSGGATLTSDTTDLVPAAVDPVGGGLQALTMSTLGEASHASVRQYFDSLNSNIWVKLRGTYQVSFDAKLVRGQPSLDVSVFRSSKNGIHCQYSPQLRRDWTHFSFICNGAETGIGDPGCDPPATVAGCTLPGTAAMQFDQSGTGVVNIDNLSLQRISPADKGNTSIYRDEVIDALKTICATAVNGPPCSFRYWLQGQNAETMANWTKPNLFVKLPTAIGQGPLGLAPGVTQDLPLNDFLVICRLIGAEPTLVVPVTFTTADAASLVDFLAGPATSHYGSVRRSLGQDAPWTSVFPKIYLEFCNECWNGGSFPGQSIGWRRNAPEYYYDYSLRTGTIFSAMRSNPYYTPALRLVMGFQEVTNWTVDAALGRTHPDLGETGAYTMSSVGGPAHFTDEVFWPQQLSQPYILSTQPFEPSGLYKQMRDIEQQRVCGADHRSRCGFMIYEFNNTTTMGDHQVQSGWTPGVNAPTQVAEDLITQGAGQGVAQALQAIQIQHVDPKLEVQNFFSLTEYSNATQIRGVDAKLWGAVVDMGGTTGNLRAAAYGLAVANASIIGPEFSCPLTGTPTFNLPADKTNDVPAVANVPLVYAFCYKAAKGNTRSILLFNTDISATHTVRFSGKNVPSGRITERAFAPESIDAINEALTNQHGMQPRARFGTTAKHLSDFNPAEGIKLPPHSIVAIDYAAGSPDPKSAQGGLSVKIVRPDGE